MTLNFRYVNCVNFSDGKRHEPASCWHDIYYTFMQARHIICITGWAVWTKVKLFRGQDTQIDNRNLGEILLAKAEEGVKVYVLIWSDRTSGDIKKTGVMGTYDQETYEYFKNTKVNCCQIPREMEMHEFTDRLQNQVSTTSYTHHQKSIICDAPVPGQSTSRLVAFVGGLDLTGGRWDTPNHDLFSTLLDEHHEDFYNNNTPNISATQGPRQPWHDIHAKVEGPVAHDIFQNFHERWRKQADKGGLLEQIDRSVIDVDMPAPTAVQDGDWNVQFFRSITSDSADFDAKKSDDYLHSKKGRMIDNSIAQAYIQSIRNAENFIYIENQYFLGSAYSWLKDNDINCHHTIPSEIAQKVVNKILRKEPFVAYIMIPMFPEGNPASAPIQEILYWQTRTIEMMYKKVGEALRMVGSRAHPTDYLVFMCPAKRELPGPHLDRLEIPEGTLAKNLRETLRFPIYVHSKMMIIDDVYIILGSANINQRYLMGLF